MPKAMTKSLAMLCWIIVHIASSTEPFKPGEGGSAGGTVDIIALAQQQARRISADLASNPDDQLSSVERQIRYRLNQRGRYKLQMRSISARICAALRSSENRLRIRA
jgi:hypothetical protein